MKNIRSTFSFIIFTTLLALASGCSNLQHVSEFSTAAEKSISGYTGLAYNYEQHCQTECRHKYEMEILKGQASFDMEKTPDCDCAKAKAKDDDAKKAYTVLTLYFSGLEKLSAGDKFVYKTSDLTDALNKAKVISDDKLKAPITSIADILLNMATNAYREHALETILDQAKDPVDKILADLIASNKFLASDSKTDRIQFQGLIALNYTGGRSVAPIQQVGDLRANRTAIEASEKTQQDLEAFNVLLQKIREAHGKLADERMSLKNKDLITYLFTQAKELRNNISKL